MNTVKNNPVLTQLVLVLVTGLATRFGFDLSPTTSAEIATGVLVVSSAVVHRFFTTPVNNPKANDGTPLVPAKK
jgi:uncharacterized protein (DUF697 family)